MANLLDSYWPYVLLAAAALVAGIVVLVKAPRERRSSPLVLLPCAGLLAAGAGFLYLAYDKTSEMVPGPAAERIALRVAQEWFSQLEHGDAKSAVDRLWRSPDRKAILEWLAARNACLGKSASREIAAREQGQYAAGRPIVRLRYQSRYERGPVVRETVGVVRAERGWGIVSYYLEPLAESQRANPEVQELEKCFEKKRPRAKA